LPRPHAVAATGHRTICSNDEGGLFVGQSGRTAGPGEVPAGIFPGD
jgi:hypothetical protein